MEEEEEALPPQDPARMMRSLALTATGEFLLFLGIVFALLGIADFITDFLGVKGVGQFLVGMALVAVAAFLLLRSKDGMPKQRPHVKRKEQRSEDYR